MPGRAAEVLKQLNGGAENNATLAAVVLDVEEIGLRDLLHSPTRIPMAGKEHEVFAWVGELEPDFSTNRFIHLLDPVSYELEDFVNLTPHISADLKKYLSMAYEFSRPRAPLPAHVLIPGEMTVETHVFGSDFSQHLLRRTNEFELLSEMLHHEDCLARLKLASKLTVERQAETQVNVWTNLDRYREGPRLYFSPVYLGDAFSVRVHEKWEKLKQRSQLVTVFDVLEEFAIYTDRELKDRRGTDPEFERRLLGAFENEIEILRMHKEEFIPEWQPRSLLELIGSPGAGIYEAIILHSHPNIYDSSVVLPSIEDLSSLVRHRKMLLERGVWVGRESRLPLECQPLSIIIQPTNHSGSEFSVLVHKEVTGLPIRDAMTIDEVELHRLYEEQGVVQTLEQLQFAAVAFSFKRGRFTPSVEVVLEKLAESERRVSERYYGGTREEVTEMMHEYLLKKRKLEIESYQEWLLKELSR